MAIAAAAIVVGAIALSVVFVIKRPQAAEAFLAWVFKWRFRLFLAFWALSIIVALGSGSTLLMLYGGLSLALAALWFFVDGPGQGVL